MGDTAAWVVAACAILAQIITGVVFVYKVGTVVAQATLRHDLLVEKIKRLEELTEKHESDIVVGSKRYHDMANVVMRLDPVWKPYRRGED